MPIRLCEGFWDDCGYSLENYIGRPATDADIAHAEVILGYRLPEAYKALVRSHNGGLLGAWMFRGKDGTESWAEGIYGIDPTKPNSLMGSSLSDGGTTAFWVEEWQYPADVGLAIADTPSAGHDMIFLDYRKCGRNGEPSVIHIDNELGNLETPLADSFGEFLAGLYVPDDEGE